MTNLSKRLFDHITQGRDLACVDGELDEPKGVMEKILDHFREADRP